MTAADRYRPGLARALPRLLGQLDREPHSPTFGSFDRDHWSWKFRDFPITMLQYGMLPLARVWSGAVEISPLTGSGPLGRWIAGALRATLDRQHGSGAFDSVAPHSQDHGVTLAMAYVLGETASALGDHLDVGLRSRLDAALLRAAAFAARSEEDYAFISNHQALFALAQRVLFERTGEARFDRESRRLVAQIVEHQSTDGWYEEYGGPDPGYETLGLHYLALLWERTRDAELLASLGRSLDFLGWCVHPDGSLGGAYGSRHTRLYYPAGLEILAAQHPCAARVAGFVGDQLGEARVLTLDTVDAQNLPTLCASWVEAARVAEAREAPPTGPPLPCEDPAAAGEGRLFAASGIRFVSNGNYYGVVHGGRGGLCRIDSRQTRAAVFEDPGWVATATNGEQWTSQRLGAGTFEDTGDPLRLRCRARFVRVRQEVLTPGRFLLLRLLNLTAFRSVWLGAWLRRQIIGRLITGAEPAPLTLEREIELGESGLTVRDRLRSEGPSRVESLSTPALYTSIHMGSARYFHGDELVESPRVFDEGAALRALRSRGVAELVFHVELSC